MRKKEVTSSPTDILKQKCSVPILDDTDGPGILHQSENFHKKVTPRIGILRADNTFLPQMPGKPQNNSSLRWVREADYARTSVSFWWINIFFNAAWSIQAVNMNQHQQPETPHRAM